MTTKTKAIMGLGLVAGLGVAVLPLASYADTDSESADVRVTVEESITITGINNQALALDFDGSMISAGTVDTGYHIVTVSTSSATGYNLTMAAPVGTLNLQTASGPNAYGGAVGFTGIGAGTVVGADDTSAYNEATLTTGFTFASTAPSAGLWGYRLSGWTADNYVSVPSAAVTIAASDSAAASQATTITFAAQAGTTTPAGSYGTWINYVASTN
ncbi:hypothetical protein FWG86_00185 [Candidatus Saccharibacteria bacterium]|nr:hypothetical protein [Candidatus Saccharibacteria bacterium]